MPFYKDLKANKPIQKRTIKNLIKLRAGLKKDIPQRTLTETLLLATWNIRDFDKPSYGYRLEESFFYIAEIIASFDIVAIQEINRDLTGINAVKKILGSDWKFIFSDTSEGARGNSERMGYLYDSKKVRFGGLAGELVLPPVKNKKKETVPIEQIWRTPMICGFKAGWARFMIASVHVQWGESTANSQSRVNEIKQLAKFLKKRTEDKKAWARKLILLGDFNIFSDKDETYKALTDEGFKSPKPAEELYTNVGKKKRQYDKILLREVEHSLEVLDGGTFNFFDYVFTNAEKDYYTKHKTHMLKADKKSKYASYRPWTTHQMSDHKPVWVEIKIDYANEYLEDKLAGNR